MLNERRRILMQKENDNKYSLKQYLTASTKYGTQKFTDYAVGRSLANRTGNLSIISQAGFQENCLNGNTGIKLLFFTGNPGATACNGCTNLEYAILPTCYACYSNSFAGCTKLKGVDLGGSPSSSYGFIRDSVFSGCSVFNILILRGSTVWRLDYTSIFNNTPFASGKAGGTLYVPQNLISSYETAANWNTILSYTNNKILSIEGSIYETKYVDGSILGGYSI